MTTTDAGEWRESILDRRAPLSSSTATPQLDLSVVIPCLNEATTIGPCVRKAIDAMTEHAIAGEVVVSDNGSSDGSIDVATAAGARVVSCATRG
jgi:hypothetical protein